MFDNLTGDDEFVLIQLLHEIEHDFNDCAWETLGKINDCPMFREAVRNSGKGYLTIIDDMISRKKIQATQHALSNSWDW